MEFVDAILDPIYGRIHITKTEREILATRRLQRLRRVKQLGSASMTYSGASHSRLEHMVGVMHITSLLVDEILRKQGRSILDDHKQTIRLAGLLHDIGHGPFSHTFEEITKFELGYEFQHDKMTQKILRFDKGLRILGSKRRRLVADFLKNGGHLAGIPGEIITGDIGTDRMDYLIRDTYYTGLGHRPDIFSLISSICLEKNKAGSPRTAVGPENISGVELLSTARYYHLNMIVHKKESRTREFLLQKAIVEYLKSISSQKRRRFIERFPNFDDTDLVARLRSCPNSYLRKFEDGKTLEVLYKIKLGEIRSYLAKYCLYRLHYSVNGLRDYCRHITQQVYEQFSGLLDNDLICVDLDLWKHNVSDVISHREVYETEKERFSALLWDESSLLRDIAGAEVLSSALSVYGDVESRARIKKLSRQLEERREIMLSDPSLISLTHQYIQNFGLSAPDDVLVLLHSLNDFYSEQHGPSEPPYLRSITRLTEIASECQEKIGKPQVKIKKFWPSHGEPFIYSPQLFSIVNALHHLGIIELRYQPEYFKELDVYTQTYYLRVVEKKIRAKVFEPTREFKDLNKKYLDIFRSRELEPKFIRFFKERNEE